MVSLSVLRGSVCRTGATVTQRRHHRCEVLHTRNPGIGPIVAIASLMARGEEAYARRLTRQAYRRGRDAARLPPPPPHHRRPSSMARSAENGEGRVQTRPVSTNLSQLSEPP